MSRPGPIILALFMLLFVVLIGTQAMEAGARASLSRYISTPPNNWAIEGSNTTGTAVNQTILKMGWNMTKLVGNVGIGDGSLGAFQTVSNGNEINYTGDYLMAGDMSMAPWDPARVINLSTQPENMSVEDNDSNESTGKRKNGFGLQNTRERMPGCKDSSCRLPKAKEKEASVNKSENATVSEVSFGSGISLNDPFHSMLLGRPVDDLWYEYPHAIPSNSYSRLVGVPAPGGCPVNVAMRAVSYGY